MTNGWIDIKNTDLMLIMGGNPAENHPCGFKWPIEAKLHRNAKIIVVDPRFTRTAASADLFLQIRAGSDIAFLGGLINFAIQNNRLAHDYLVHYTNASFVVKDGFKLPEDGLYSGFDPSTQTYNTSTWNYEEAGQAGKAGAAGKTEGPSPASLPPNVAYDVTLQHPRSVFQLLKQQYSRYTPEMVERITGIPRDEFLKAADLFTSVRKDGDMKKVATIIYAVGWTHHTFGTQIIRTAAMLQLLLGNVGRAGGGVNALRGHSNIQGATDMAGVFDSLPGYLKMPAPDDVDLATYLKRTTPTSSKPSEWDSYNYWSNTPKFTVSFLKALYGDAAEKANDWAFHYLPKIDRRYSWVEIWDDMYNGQVKGMFAFGMNGVQIGPNSRKNIEALKRAEWLVVGEIYPDETSEFWRAPGTTPEEMKRSRRRCNRLPCAGSPRKTGTFVTLRGGCSGKTSRSRRPATPGSIRKSLANFLNSRAVPEDGGAFPDPILNLSWNYTDPRPVVSRSWRRRSMPRAGGHYRSNRPDHQGRPAAAGFCRLKEDAPTLCGQLGLYSGSWTGGRRAMTRSGRGHRGSVRLGDLSELGVVVAGELGRVLYNRASCDPDRATPWDSDAARFGGTRRRSAGSARRAPTSRRTRRRRITWARSS
jgi:formate dehydrogenase major subunit